MTLQTERIRTIEQVAAFVEASAPVEFQPLDRDGAYAFVARTLTQLGYRVLDKPSKALVKRYLAKTTGYSRAKLTRLIRQHHETAKVVDRRDGNQGRPFARVYTPPDIRLLARVDADLGQMSGLATRVVPHREHHVFGDARFERLAGISASHIYNLRGSRTYRTQRTVVQGTKATAVSTCRRISTTTGRACSPPSARPPTAASAASTRLPMCRRPTTSCAPCRTPKPVSSLVSRSHNSTPRPMRTATCRPPERSTPSATACSRPSPKPGPRSPETQHPRDPAPRFPPPAHRRFTV